MAAAVKDFVVEQHATFERSMIWKDALGVPVPLTGYTAKLQVRTLDAPSTVVLELSTANGRIVLNAVPGQIQFVVTAIVTAGLSGWTSGVYDLALLRTVDGAVKRLLRGKIILDPGVTVI